MSSGTDPTERDLGDSGSVPALLSYSVLMLVTAWASDYWIDHRELTYAFVGLSAFFGLLRFQAGKTLRRCSRPEVPAAKRSYTLCVLAQGSCWSAFASSVVFFYGREWSGLLALLVTVGIVAASTSNLTSHYPLMRAFILLMMLPPACVLAFGGGPFNLLTAFIMVLFSYYMTAIGRRHAERYTNLSLAMLALDKSRQRQQELLLRWRSVVENAPDIIATLDREGRIQFINRYETEVGQPFENLLAEEDRERVRTSIATVFAECQSLAFDAHSAQGDVWYSCRVGPVEHAGAVESVVVIAVDVSERQRMHQELQHSRSQLRLLTAHQQRAIEDERRHIAREIHDELGQLLTGLKIELAWVERRVEREDVQGKMREMGELLDRTMGTVRSLSSRLRPPLLDDLGTAAALDWLLQDVCGRSGLEYHLNASLAGRVPGEECSLAVFRVCQEALTNVVRHSRATRVQVDLSAVGDSLHITISDNGTGFPSEQQTSSLGLLGLQERVLRLGGTVQVRSQPGQGTCVAATIPL